MDKFFEALRPEENPFAAFLYGEFKKTGDPVTLRCLLEEQEEFHLVKMLMQEKEKER